MKKKIIVVATVFVVALVAAYGVYNNQNKNALTDLMLDNVEALAQPESGSGADCINRMTSWCFYFVYLSPWDYGTMVRVDDAERI